MAAISILSSTAAFDRQCERAGLTAAWTDALRASGITSSTGLALLDCCRSCAGGGLSGGRFTEYLAPSLRKKDP